MTVAVARGILLQFKRPYLGDDVIKDFRDDRVNLTRGCPDPVAGVVRKKLRYESEQETSRFEVVLDEVWDDAAHLSIRKSGTVRGRRTWS